MAVKPDRFRIYKLQDVGTDGNVDQQYVLEASTANDEGYWGGVSPISARETTVGAQGQHVVIYDVTMDDTVPLANGDDARLAVLGPDDAEVQILQVRAVMLLRVTREKQARCEEVSDANDTLVTD